MNKGGFRNNQREKKCKFNLTFKMKLINLKNKM